MFSPNDNDGGKENRTKRQSLDSPSAVMSPSVRVLSRKMTRLSDTPVRGDSGNVHQVAPHSPAALSELVSDSEIAEGKSGNVVAKNFLHEIDPNIEETLLEEIPAFDSTAAVEVETTQEAMSENLIEEGDGSFGKSSTSVGTAVAEQSEARTPVFESPGMSEEMKRAIKAHLKSDTDHGMVAMDVESDEGNAANEDIGPEIQTVEDMNICCSSTASEKSRTEVGTEILKFQNAPEVVLGMPDFERADEMTEVIFHQESMPSVETKNADTYEASCHEEAKPSPIQQFENEDTVRLFASIASEDNKNSCPANVDDLTLSARKEKALGARSAHLESLSAPGELADYAQERVADFSFLINEAYCNTSVFCENCYSMRIELGLFADKFKALAGQQESEKTSKAGNKFYVAELENILRTKQDEILKMESMHQEAMSELRAQMEEVTNYSKRCEKDAEDYKFLFENEAKNRKDEISELKKKLYAADDLVMEMKQALEKRNNDIENNLAPQVAQLETDNEKLSQRVTELNAINELCRLKVKELECDRNRAIDEKGWLEIRLRQASVDMENARSDLRRSEEYRSVTEGISLLSARMEELKTDIEAAVRQREDIAVNQKTSLHFKLMEALQKFMAEAADGVTSKNWNRDDVQCAISIFEAVVGIIIEDVPHYDIVIEQISKRREADELKLQQLIDSLKEMSAEKAKWEALFDLQSSKFAGFQEALLEQLSGNMGCFVELLQNLKKDVEDKLHSLSQTQLQEDISRGVSELMERMAVVQKRVIDRLERQSEMVTSSTESGIEIIKDKAESLQDVVEKILAISNAMSNSLSKSDPLDRTRDAEQNDQVEALRNELMELERERDVFRKTCEHSEEKQQELQRANERLQQTEEDLKEQNATMRKEMAFQVENTTRALRISESLTVEKEKLVRENTVLSERVIHLDNENNELKQKLDVMVQNDAKVSELERLVEFLKKENDRLGHACDDADDEVGSLKKQIFELTHTVAKLEAEKKGEGKEGVNRRMGYIEAPPIQPRIPFAAPIIHSRIYSPPVHKNASLPSPAKTELSAKTEGDFKKEVEVAEEASEEGSKDGKSSNAKVDRDQSCRTS